MIDFTADMHVSEREASGSFSDCTPASMLEVLRLALPNGRRLPTDMAEVDRLRAASGVGKGGVTLDQVIFGAEELYGLTDDYTLTDDWNVVASFLEDPTVVAVVQGRMGSFPFTVARWDTYTGPHAVAKHGVRVLCDPLAPRGKYVGEEVNLSGWKAYFTALPGAQAFAMHTGGASVPINAAGYNVTSGKRALVHAVTPILDETGKEINKTTIGARYVAIGIQAGKIACLFSSGTPWPDHVARPTVLFVAVDAVTLEDAPSPPPATTNGSGTLVELSINGKIVYPNATS